MMNKEIRDVASRVRMLREIAGMSEAEAAANVAVIAANADHDVVKIQADAAEYAGQKEAAVNSAIAQSVTPELIEYQYALRWDGKLPTYMMSEGSTPIVNLPMMGEEE